VSHLSQCPSKYMYPFGKPNSSSNVVFFRVQAALLHAYLLQEGLCFFCCLQSWVVNCVPTFDEGSKSGPFEVFRRWSLHGRDKITVNSRNRALIAGALIPAISDRVPRRAYFLQLNACPESTCQRWVHDLTDMRPSYTVATQKAVPHKNSNNWAPTIALQILSELITRFELQRLHQILDFALKAQTGRDCEPG
jgi:hypothetical protein